MVTHLEFRLYDGFASTTRLVTRLHALGVEVAELHASAERMCVDLTDERDVRRVRTVLNRLADVEVVPHTTYIVWSEPLDASRPRHHRGSRISA